MRGNIGTDGIHFRFFGVIMNDIGILEEKQRVGKDWRGFRKEFKRDERYLFPVCLLHLSRPKYPQDAISLGFGFSSDVQCLQVPTCFLSPRV